MKKIIFYILVALLVVTVGCNDDDNSLPVIKPEKTGTVTIGEKHVRMGTLCRIGLDDLQFQGRHPLL